MVIGADDAELTPGTRDEVSFYNSSFLINPAGNLVSSYRKTAVGHVRRIRAPQRMVSVPETAGARAGRVHARDGCRDLRHGRLDVQTSVLICFEDVFPHITREHVKDDTDFLLNLTNNGWFGESAAQWQHAANAVFRAIENGLPCWCAAPTTA